MKFSKSKKNLLINILDEYASYHELWDLPIDENGKYYPNDPDSPNDQTPYDETYMAEEANMISSLIDRLD